MPPRAKNLMPLSGAGLCDAETMTPKSASMSAIRNAAAGVGMTPASSTSTPELASPAATAAARNSPETRGSRATTAVGRLPGGAASRRRTALAQDDSGRLGQAEREIGGEVAVGQPPHPVRAEERGMRSRSADQRFEN